MKLRGAQRRVSPLKKKFFFGDLGCTYLTMMAALLRKAVYSYFFFLVKRGNR
jgi:hypothetical protein